MVTILENLAKCTVELWLVLATVDSGWETLTLVPIVGQFKFPVFSCKPDKFHDSLAWRPAVSQDFAYRK